MKDWLCVLKHKNGAVDDMMIVVCPAPEQAKKTAKTVWEEDGQGVKAGQSIRVIDLSSIPVVAPRGVRAATASVVPDKDQV